MRLADTADQLRTDRDLGAIRGRQDELMAFLSARSGHHRERNADGRSIPLFVETGRWLADCPECGAGIEASPTLPELTCLGCGRVYKPALPAELDVATELLELRPDLGTRNWYPQKGETVADLHHENELYGGIGVDHPGAPDETPALIVAVDATFADSHDGDRYTDGGLADELLKRFGTGYTILHNDGEDPTHVILHDQDPKDVATFKDAVSGDDVTP